MRSFPSKTTDRPIRKLTLQRLEERHLMAADIDLDNGVLTIEGTNNDDIITIEVNSADPNEVVATITDRQGNVLEQRDYDRSRIDHIEVDALNGYDEVYNRTNITSELRGGAGYNVLVGGSNDDVLIGGNDGNSFQGNGGNDTLIGGAGDDEYIFEMSPGGPGLGHDTINEAANQGKDLLSFWNFGGSVTLDISNTSQQVIHPGKLSLTLSSDTAIEDVIGSNVYENDITGNTRDNILFGGQRRDTIRGEAGNDVLIGLDGNDVIYGGDHNDTISGGNGDDVILAGDGDDQVWGGDGGDVVNAGAGDDTVYGEAGRDWLFGELGNDWIDGGADIDNIHGGADNDTLLGGLGNDILFGNDGDDTLSGNEGHDWLDGGADNDRLFGGDGYDRLFGRAGNDWLDGGHDGYADELWGGAGYDTFVEYWLYDGEETLLERDQVMDGGEPGAELIHRSFIFVPKSPVLRIRR